MHYVSKFSQKDFFSGVCVASLIKYPGSKLVSRSDVLKNPSNKNAEELFIFSLSEREV